VYLRERQNELAVIVGSLQRSEQLTQLEDDQKGLLRAATNMAYEDVKTAEQETSAAIAATRAKLEKTKAAKTAAKLNEEIKGLTAKRQTLMEVADRYAGDLATLDEPAIPGRKRYRVPSNTDLLAALPLTKDQKASLQANTSAVKAAAEPSLVTGPVKKSQQLIAGAGVKEPFKATVYQGGGSAFAVHGAIDATGKPTKAGKFATCTMTDPVSGAALRYFPSLKEANFVARRLAEQGLKVPVANTSGVYLSSEQDVAKKLAKAISDARTEFAATLTTQGT
jgi:hypothetical protein